MKNMQWGRLKFLVIIFSFFSSSFLFAQSATHRLSVADSLFERKQYTQSLEHYKHILAQQEYSPAMLLKMAFIEEGLKKNAEALYYLNLYYLATQDEAVLDKMELLSKKNNLQGYEVSENAQIVTRYREFHDEISLALSVLIFFFFALTVFTYRQKNRPVAPAIPLFLFSLLLAAHLYVGEPDEQGIIAASPVYLMTGPSGGASVTEIVQAGHRVDVLGEKDVWVQIKWRGETAYIRKNLLLPVAL